MHKLSGRVGRILDLKNMQALREYNTKYAFDPEGGKKGGVESIDEAWAKSEKFETVKEGQG